MGCDLFQTVRHAAMALYVAYACDATLNLVIPGRRERSGAPGPESKRLGRSR